MPPLWADRDGHLDRVVVLVVFLDAEIREFLVIVFIAFRYNPIGIRDKSHPKMTGLGYMLITGDGMNRIGRQGRHREQLRARLPAHADAADAASPLLMTLAVKRTVSPFLGLAG